MSADHEVVSDRLRALEETADRVEVKLAEVLELVEAAAGDAAGIAGRPPADLSPEHIGAVVEELPADVVAEIDATANLAEDLAWQVEHLLGRWEALEDALGAAVGVDEVHNGGDLVRAVEGRTRARVTEEVLDALGLLGSMEPDNWREVLQGHAVEPRAR